MIVLGLNAWHGDSSACLLREGRLVAAAEEERFRRVKHWAGFPSQAIAWCLAEAGLTLADVDCVAVNGDPRASLFARLRYAALRRPDPRLLLDRLRNQARRASIADQLAEAFPGQRFAGTIRRVEHHLAHMASAFLVSPFDEAAVVSVDGFGDFASAAWGHGAGDRLAIEARVPFPHSLGVFYQAVTQHLGFPHYGDEYKVMGLAPYGEATFMGQMRRLVRLREDGGFALDLAGFRHHREKIDYAWEGGAPSVGRLASPLFEELFGPARAPDAPIEQRHRDIARSAQAMYEEAFFHLLNALHRARPVEALALAGGCAMNSVANGKIRRATPFRRVYVQAAAGDAGGALGAALIAHRDAGGARGFVMDHAFYGPAATGAEIDALLAGRSAELAAARCAITRPGSQSALVAEVAQAIAAGEVVGWFQGRMEWGPRALGARSILGDPRRADMKDILNARIKRRESFRPFAPSILREAVSEWFEEEDDVPFMAQVFQIRPEMRARVPAVAHVDGSGRLQTVTAGAAPLYHALICAFRDLTGVPMLLNTSFNENEPIVCRPGEALDCFLRTQLDMLVLGDVVLRRSR